ncbi:hypothetical protein [Asticcacaulis benevestitus]|uniref:Uncharacterized protein n=1 Tax=Asticcacaulis benevestitus DSM 16100 = ATCC BAA-896 TaxID=1121022 RepID=V4RMV1_9CAUL|nr:hypothetical protein [Asticcacaulis benevestitus]ESQ92558.1 hypothetical protein ABENE_07935 [Asticcacaulis benevestitus DSM 16100 = ATCC BAA-896]
MFVPSDAVLKQVGQTRAQYNAANPRAEKEWRKAWVVKGTPNDNGYFEMIRTQSAAPKDKTGEGN